MKYFKFVVTVFILFVLAINIYAEDNPAKKTLEEKTYAKLDTIRNGKKKELRTYLERVEALAKKVVEDPLMRKYFVIKNKFYELQKKATPPEESIAAIKQFKAGIRSLYLQNYLTFYDILFVGSDGFIFSTIRNESDYHKNLFKDDLKGTSLSKKLSGNMDSSFVDYEFYKISEEPSAFFVEPMVEGGKHLGWFVMQCAINKINNIFSQSDGLGKTGEVFLVNRQHEMMTESRFNPEDSILRLHLSKENIEGKFKEVKGHKAVIDYRRQRALTSFEVCPVLNSEWLLIAKIDEDEVVTHTFSEHFDKNSRALLTSLKAAKPVFCEEVSFPKPVKIVDIDEFKKSDKNGSNLITFGVSTCTAVVLSLPEKFSYMGHASSYDVIYGSTQLDLIRHMLKRIKTFEIYPYQLRDIQAVIIAPHLNSFRLALKKLVDAGFFLSQIKFIYNGDAESATVFHDPQKAQTNVEWKYKERSSEWQNDSGAFMTGNEALKILTD